MDNNLINVLLCVMMLLAEKLVSDLMKRYRYKQNDKVYADMNSIEDNIVEEMEW